MGQLAVRGPLAHGQPSDGRFVELDPQPGFVGDLHDVIFREDVCPVEIGDIEPVLQYRGIVVRAAAFNQDADSKTAAQAIELRRFSGDIDCLIPLKQDPSASSQLRIRDGI
jgi:hypothetical protein